MSVSSVLSRETDERDNESARDPLVHAFEVVMEETEFGRSDESGGRGVVRPFLLVDLGAVLDYVRGDRREGPRIAVDRVGERSRPAVADGEREADGGGRSVLARLFLVGAALGVAYVLRKRAGSVDELTSEVTDRARSVADRTAKRSGETAGRAETVTDEAADTIRERGETAAEAVQKGSEAAADRVEEGGERAADQIEEAGETVEDVEERAEEATDENEE